MKKVIMLFLVAFFASILITTFYSFAEERITLTTYYPAPYGVYRDMNVTGTLNVEGGIYYNKTYGLFEESRYDTCDPITTDIGYWDLCWLSRYQIQDVGQSPPSVQANCRVYATGQDSPGSTYPLGSTSQPTWNLYVDVENCDLDGNDADVICEATCMNFR
jgi:hypothetical protein